MSFISYHRSSIIGFLLMVILALIVVILSELEYSWNVIGITLTISGVISVVYFLWATKGGWEGVNEQVGKMINEANGEKKDEM